MPPCDPSVLPISMLLGVVVGACIATMIVGMKNEYNRQKRDAEAYREYMKSPTRDDDPYWDYDPSQPLEGTADK